MMWRLICRCHRMAGSDIKVIIDGQLDTINIKAGRDCPDQYRAGTNQTALLHLWICLKVFARVFTIKMAWSTNFAKLGWNHWLKIITGEEMLWCVNRKVSSVASFTGQQSHIDYSCYIKVKKLYWRRAQFCLNLGRGLLRQAGRLPWISHNFPRQTEGGKLTQVLIADAELWFWRKDILTTTDLIISHYFWRLWSHQTKRIYAYMHIMHIACFPITMWQK